MKKSLGRIVSVLCILLVMGMTVCAADVEDIKKNKVLQTNSDVELHEVPDAASAVTGTLSAATPVIVKEDAKDGWCMVAYQETVGYVQVTSLGLLGSQIPPAVSEAQSVTGNEAAPPAGSALDNGVQSSDGAVLDNGEQPAVGAAQDNGEQAAAGAAQDNGTQSSDDIVQNDATQDVPANVNSLDEEFKSVQEQNLLSFQEAEAAKAREKSDKVWKVIIAVLVVAIFAVGIVTTLGNKGKKKKR